ncbi:hypothetical protein AXE65_09165 [Ventosimonas gracilis]|uniref:DNA polymerase III subunit gamma/tau n=1 Tax=Ventosimonas gracilis TaxID=1680762 RepID=A0A139SXQ7_9GAMM|nr:DNA polymerase III subunit gamma/tau [Ventosimonas gracilis]KXU39359.1 hypothetical protein AXE65_09165 [Ventosimonas gracilis]
MSYQVLARKWRPRTFHQMAGQEHVLKALINALDSGRLHHAYLFTGTRGVGKTSIARILAKCLNCEQGVSAQPCGVCAACTQIDQGRFVDLIEVDAASRTKVEDTRDLLENVQYAPTRARYKVYLIDEVHMLSAHSFNALLKTLEEPPPHVKFLLATTDPQKLPVTVLSRCLQFALKNMSAERVVQHLQHVLQAEQVPFEDEALWLLGRAADGSMRDALSLTDQAIAFGEGKLMSADVRSMLGTLDHSQLHGLLQALKAGDAPGLMAQVNQLAELGPDWAGLLAELINLLHRIAIAQVVPDALDNGEGDREAVLQLAQSLPPEDVQFYYQMALIGRRDLPLAPQPRGGFEMLLLRMLAFRPHDSEYAPSVRLSGSAEVKDHSPSPAESMTQIVAEEPPPIEQDSGFEPSVNSGQESLPQASPPSAGPAAESHSANSAELAERWQELLPQLGLSGMCASIASHSTLAAVDGDHWLLHLDPSQPLLSETQQQRLGEALEKFHGRPIRLRIEQQTPSQQTPAQRSEQQKQIRLQQAELAIAKEPMVMAMMEQFAAVIEPGSIQPID